MSYPSDPVAAIQQAVKASKYRIGWHAVQHMFEEGFDKSQVLEVLTGKLTVLEEYEEDNRVLVLGDAATLDQSPSERIDK